MLPRSRFEEVIATSYCEMESKDGDKTVHAVLLDGTVLLVTKPNPSKLAELMKGASDESYHRQHSDGELPEPRSIGHALGIVNKARSSDHPSASLEFDLVYAGPDDVKLLVAQRLKMWREVRPELEARIEESETWTREWTRKMLAEAKLIGFIIKAKDGKVAGSGCIWLRDEQPRPTNPRMIVPYLMSMYTEPEFRRKGVAKLIVQSALNWCRERGYERVVLHASDAGRPLYESLGFEPTTEMRTKL